MSRVRIVVPERCKPIEVAALVSEVEETWVILKENIRIYTTELRQFAEDHNFWTWNSANATRDLIDSTVSRLSTFHELLDLAGVRFEENEEDDDEDEDEDEE